MPMEIRKNVRGIAHDTDVARITLVRVPDRPGIAAAIFQPLAEASISVDTIAQSSGADGTTDLSFTVSRGSLPRAARHHPRDRARGFGADAIDTADDLAKVSIVGTGMQSAPGYAARMFGTLAERRHQHRHHQHLGHPHHLRGAARPRRGRRPRAAQRLRARSRGLSRLLSMPRSSHSCVYAALSAGGSELALLWRTTGRSRATTERGATHADVGRHTSAADIARDPRAPSIGRDRHGTLGRPTSTRRGYAFPRAEHRHPVYGSQARRDSRQMPYIVGFIVVVLGLALFLYVGLNWATGPGRVAALATPPTPTAIAVAPPPTPEPSPTAVEQTYIVKAGDNPASIAQQFGVKTEDLMAVQQHRRPAEAADRPDAEDPTPASTLRPASQPVAWRWYTEPLSPT